MGISLLVSAVRSNEMTGLCIAIHLEMGILLLVSAAKRYDWPMHCLFQLLKEMTCLCESH